MKKMLSKIKNRLLSYLPSQNTLQNVLFISIAALFFLYCFSIPTFSNRYPLNYVSIAICALMCAAMLVYVFLYGKFKINAMVMLLVLFNITILIAHVINLSFNDIPKTILLMSLVAFVVYQFLSSYKKIDPFIILVLISGFLFSIIFIIHYRSDLFNLSDIFDSRLGSYFDNENEISKEFGFFCAVALASVFRYKNIYVKLSLSFFVLILFFLILSTGSISNLFTIGLVSAIVIVVCQKTTKGKLIAGLTAVGLILLFVILVQLPFMSYFKTRIENIFNTLLNPTSKTDGSAADRLNGALTSLLIGANRFIFGFGYMSAPDYTYNSIQSHNNFAELFIDFGIVGLIIYEALVLLPLFRAFKTNNKSLVFSVGLYMFIFQLFLTTYYKKFEYIFFALLYTATDDLFVTQYVLFDSSRFKKHKPVVFEIIPSLTPVGGAETFLVDFIESFKNKYVEEVELKLIILYQQEDSVLLKQLKKNKIDIFILNKKTGLDFLAACKLRNLILEYNPIVIHTHLLSISTLKMALPIKRKRIKCIHTIHHNVSKENRNQKLLRYLVKRDYLFPICVAKKPANEYSVYFGRKVDYINNGINLKKYDSSKPLYLRKNNLLVVGRFVDVKNQQYLIKQYSKFSALRDHNVVFLGDGPLLDECKKESKDLGLNKFFSFKGYTKDVAKYMSDSKLLVMPSLNEGNPMVINEAFASGMAVVGNNVGGIVDLLKDVKIGGLQSIDDPKLFVSKILKTLNEISKKKIDHIDYNLAKYNIDSTVESYYEYFVKESL